MKQLSKKKNQELEIKKGKIFKEEKINLIDLMILIFFKGISFVFNI